MAGRWDTITVDGGEMRCYVSAPAGDGSGRRTQAEEVPARKNSMLGQESL